MPTEKGLDPCISDHVGDHQTGTIWAARNGANQGSMRIANLHFKRKARNSEIYDCCIEWAA